MHRFQRQRLSYQQGPWNQIGQPFGQKKGALQARKDFPLANQEEYTRTSRKEFPDPQRDASRREDDDAIGEAINHARKHYILPLTSEFMEKSMLALETLLAGSPSALDLTASEEASVGFLRALWMNRLSSQST